MIIGNRINLIALNDKCFNIILKWVNNPDLRKYTGTRFPISVREHEIWFKNHIFDKENKTFAIEIKETQEIIGIIGNSEYEDINKLSALFIYIGEEKYRGFGYGVEAVNLLVSFCFNEMNIHKLYCYIYDFNEASKKMFEKCGFLKEGLLKKHWYRNGNYNDVVIMSLIKPE